MTHAERTYRLLIVDDDETDRKLYGWLLARQAPGVFEIEQAADGAAGIAALIARCWISACPMSPASNSWPRPLSAASCRAPSC